MKDNKNKSDEQIYKELLEYFYTGTAPVSKDEDPLTAKVQSLDENKISINNGVVSYDGSLFWRGPSHAGTRAGMSTLPFGIERVAGDFYINSAHIGWSGNMPDSVGGVCDVWLAGKNNNVVIDHDISAKTVRFQLISGLTIKSTITADNFIVDRARTLKSIEGSISNLNIKKLSLLKCISLQSAGELLDASKYAIEIADCPALSLGILALFSGGDHVSITGKMSPLSQQYLGTGLSGLVQMIRDHRRQEIDI